MWMGISEDQNGLQNIKEVPATGKTRQDLHRWLTFFCLLVFRTSHLRNAFQFLSWSTSHNYIFLIENSQKNLVSICLSGPICLFTYCFYFIKEVLTIKLSRPCSSQI